MPVQSRREGDDLLVDNVDLKRAARNLLNKTRAPGWKPPSDLNQAMELMASCFGYANLLVANQQAPKVFSGLDDQEPKPTNQAGRLVEPLVVVYEADDRLDDEALTHELERAFDVDAGKSVMTLDMSDDESITTLRQFRKLEKPDVVVCTSVELGASSGFSSELMHAIVNNPGIEFRLVMRTFAEAEKLFSTWVNQDNSPAIPEFFLAGEWVFGRALIPSAVVKRVHASGMPGSAPAVDPEQAMMTRAMTARRDGRQMTRIGAGLEELTARADALGGGNRTAEQNGSNSGGELPPARPRRKPRP